MRQTAGTILLGWLAVAAALGGGCKGTIPNPLNRWPLYYYKEFAGPSRVKLTAQALNAKDTDLRRVGIVQMTRRYWGGSELSLKTYALVAGTTLYDPTVRGVALRALARGRQAAAVHADRIFLALSDESTDVRWDAAVALDRVTSEKAVSPLRARALPKSETSVDVRTAAARALRHYRTTDAAAALIACLDDPDYAVRRAAHESLVEIVGRDLGPDPEHWIPLTKEIPPLPPKRSWWE